MKMNLNKWKINKVEIVKWVIVVIKLARLLKLIERINLKMDLYLNFSKYLKDEFSLEN